MLKIKVKGRNDLDLPDEMEVTLNQETGDITFKFDGVLREFTVEEAEATPLLKIIEELRNETIHS